MTGTEVLTLCMFGAVVILTLYITLRASKQNVTAGDFYSGGRGFSGFQNGLAISGDYMSAASFLGISGLIALNGYDGFLYSIGFLVAWLVALLLVAELMRNTGRYTMADVLSYRMKQRPVRTAAATSTVVVSIFYLLAQMAGAGKLVALLIGAESDTAKNLTIAAVGALMIIYVTVGGMRGTTYVQIVKAVLLVSGTLVVVFLTLLEFKFNVSRMLGDAAEASGREVEEFLGPGAKYGLTGTTQIDFISLALALVLGTAGLPHILIRFYTVPTARDARISVNWAIAIIGGFYLCTLVLGFGGAALLGPDTIKAADAGGNLTSPLLAEEVGGGDGTVGGAILLAFISAVAFATILAVVAGLTLASSSSFSHDFYANVVKKGDVLRAGGGQGRADRRVRDRRHRDRAQFVRPGSEHRVPGRAGVRDCGVGEPARDPVQPVLAAVQHPGRGVVDLRRADHLPRADHLLAERLRLGHGAVREQRLVVLPAGQPGHHLDPGRFPVRHHRHPHLEGAGDAEGVRELRGAGAHRRRCREGNRALRTGSPRAWCARQRQSERRGLPGAPMEGHREAIRFCP